MSKIKEIKDQLSRIYSQVPGDFNLSEVRFHISQACQKLANLEKKETRREAVQQQLNQQPQIKVNPWKVRDTLDTIEKMIAEEKSKIKDKKQPASQEDETYFD